jgi:polygalacturonase
MKPVLFILLMLFCLNLIYLQTIAEGNKMEDEIKKYTLNLPFRMQVIKPPIFPDTNFNVSEFGGKNDGLFNNTEAFNKAIEKCSKAGGGHVIISSGVWLTGPVKMMSNVDLHLEKGALVVFSPDHTDYELIQAPGSSSYTCASPIYGFNLDNIAISGEGLLDGNGLTWRPVKKSKLTSSQWKKLVSSGGVVNEKGDVWWPSKQAANAEKYLAKKKKSELTKQDYKNVKDFLRPNMVYLVNCKNILLDGITIQNPPRFHLYFQKSENGIIRNVKVMSEWWAQNADGLDIISSRNVIMYNCTINAGDDAICMKSDKVQNRYPALENIVIADCVVYHGHGGFVIGSNTGGGVKNVFVRNCSFIGTDTGLRFKSTMGKGSVVENIFIENIYMKDIQNEAITFNMLYKDAGAVKYKNQNVDKDKIPSFQKIQMKNIVCVGAKRAFYVNTNDIMPVKDIYLSDAVITADKGFDGSYARNFVFDNVKIIPKEGPVFNIVQGKDFLLRNVFCPNGSNPFIRLSGKDSENINLTETDYSKAKFPFEYSNGADKNAVKIY